MEEELKEIRILETMYNDQYLISIVINLLNMAKETPDGHKFKFLIPSMSFSAFTIEAMCNTYGSQLFKDLFQFKSTSFIGKIIMISDKLGIDTDFSKEPWQTINKIKNFRNRLVHAKPETSSKTFKINDNFPINALYVPRSEKDILSMATIENAE
ncbi:MAG: hypothetical protein GY932_15125, partial [Arcobacter sp.]|nr:hypothetical protein [Arcobacter sp.]